MLVKVPTPLRSAFPKKKKKGEAWAEVHSRGIPVPRLGTHNRLNYETPPAPLAHGSPNEHRGEQRRAEYWPDARRCWGT